MYAIYFPRGLVPEEHGWQVVNPIVPHQQLDAAMQELRTFGFVSTHFKRFTIPWAYPAGLVFTGYDAGRGQYYGLYNPPFECRDRKVTRADIWREILSGVVQPEGSAPQVTVSHTDG